MENLKTNVLGRTGLEITNLSFSTMELRLLDTANAGHLVENVKTAAKGGLSGEICTEAKRRLDFAGIVAGIASV